MSQSLSLDVRRPDGATGMALNATLLGYLRRMAPEWESDRF